MNLYRRKSTAPIEAYQLTIDNMEKLAEWCKGSIKGTKLSPEKRIVQFYNQYYPAGECDVEVGDWIVKDGVQFSVYNDYAFNEVFISIGE